VGMGISSRRITASIKAVDVMMMYFNQTIRWLRISRRCHTLQSALFKLLETLELGVQLGKDIAHVACLFE
jgi:hypothetical protein